MKISIASVTIAITFERGSSFIEGEHEIALEKHNIQANSVIVLFSICKKTCDSNNAWSTSLFQIYKKLSYRDEGYGIIVIH